jgi:hypothetical protein
MYQVTCNPIPYFKCNGSATVTSYRYLNVTKTSLVTKQTKKVTSNAT